MSKEEKLERNSLLVKMMKNRGAHDEKNRPEKPQMDDLVLHEQKKIKTDIAVANVSLLLNRCFSIRKKHPLFCYFQFYSQKIAAREH